MTTNAPVFAILAGSYLLGSLPFGLWIARRWKGVDIRTLGSGNIGSTNVGRVCGPVAGGLVFALDVCKGLIPPLVASGLQLDSHWHVLAALLAIIGHNYSVWLGFKGGKGIATSLGALIGVAPPVAALAFAIFLLEYVTIRYVSLGSILAALSLPPLMLWFYPNDWFRFGFAVFACVMAVYKHRANIGRLRAGTEPKVQMPWHPKPSAPTEPEMPASDNSANVSAVVTASPAADGQNPPASRSESASAHG